jgi:hypothetical protein
MFSLSYGYLKLIYFGGIWNRLFLIFILLIQGQLFFSNKKIAFLESTIVNSGLFELFKTNNKSIKCFENLAQRFVWWFETFCKKLVQ